MAWNQDSHTHEFEEVGRTFTSPLGSFSGSGFTNDFIEKATFGFTNIELRCKECGDVKVEQTIGKAHNES